MQQDANFPFLAYNLGESKIILQNIQEVGTRKAYILNMEPDEKFVCFIKFNKYEDIGFFTEDLRIECCSHIAYLTRKDDKNKFFGNKINILLVDPFCVQF